MAGSQTVDIRMGCAIAITPKTAMMIRPATPILDSLNSDQFFENEVPPKALEPLQRRAREAGVAVHVGFCEKAGGRYFNTALLTDEEKIAARIDKLVSAACKKHLAVQPLVMTATVH